MSNTCEIFIPLYVTSKVSSLKRVPWHSSHTKCKSAINCIPTVT